MFWNFLRNLFYHLSFIMSIIVDTQFRSLSTHFPTICIEYSRHVTIISPLRQSSSTLLKTLTDSVLVLFVPQHLHHREAASSGAEDTDKVCSYGPSAGGGQTQRPHEPSSGQSYHHKRATGQSPTQKRKHQEVSLLLYTLHVHTYVQDLTQFSAVLSLVHYGVVAV